MPAITTQGMAAHTNASCSSAVLAGTATEPSNWFIDIRNSNSNSSYSASARMESSVGCTLLFSSRISLYNYLISSDDLTRPRCSAGILYVVSYLAKYLYLITMASESKVCLLDS